MHRSFEGGAGRAGRRAHGTDRRRGDDPIRDARALGRLPARLPARALSLRPLPLLLGPLLFGAAPLLGQALFLGPAAGGAAGGNGRCRLVDQAVPDEELVRRGRRGL